MSAGVVVILLKTDAEIESGMRRTNGRHKAGGTCPQKFNESSRLEQIKPPRLHRMDQDAPDLLAI